MPINCLSNAFLTGLDEIASPRCLRFRTTCVEFGSAMQHLYSRLSEIEQIKERCTKQRLYRARKRELNHCLHKVISSLFRPLEISFLFVCGLLVSNLGLLTTSLQRNLCVVLNYLLVFFFRSLYYDTPVQP